MSGGPGELMTAGLDRGMVRDEMEQARQEFRRLLDGADNAGLARASNGTKWTNQQLLFHMLFGYLIVRALLVLARAFAGCRPGPEQRSPGCWTPRAGRFTRSTTRVVCRRADHPALAHGRCHG